MGERSLILPPGLSPALAAAYTATDYVVPQLELTLRVGEACPALDAHLAKLTTKTACFISAANPQSRRLSAHQNRQANRQLQAQLRASCQRGVFHGEGRGRDGEWPPEQSFLVLGLSQKRATELAIAFQQNAYLWYDSTATLVVTRQSDWSARSPSQLGPVDG